MRNISELIFKYKKVFPPISAIAADDLRCIFNIKPHGKPRLKKNGKIFIPMKLDFSNFRFQ